MRVLSLLVLLAGCASNSANGEPQAPQPDPQQRSAEEEPADGDAPNEVDGDAADGEPEEGDAPAGEGGEGAGGDAKAAPTPASLYEECKDRVEQPQADGECTTDADCVRAGCGSEVCTTTAAAGDIMTTCEDRLCFHVLDTCGCHDGVCSWTLKDEVPERKGGLEPMPKKLPDTLP